MSCSTKQEGMTERVAGGAGKSEVIQIGTCDR
jgi:hypothetical protein